MTPPPIPTPIGTVIHMCVDLFVKTPYPCPTATLTPTPLVSPLLSPLNPAGVVLGAFEAVNSDAVALALVIAACFVLLAFAAYWIVWFKDE